MDIPFWTMGGTIDLANLKPENLTVEVIGSTLAKINRFNGRPFVTWSVAAHSVLVELLCPPDLQPWALLHDAHEAFIGDLTGPAEDFICSCGTATAVRNAVVNAKGRLDRQIAASWKVAVRALSPDLRRADHIALRAEAYVFMGVEHNFATADDIKDFERAVTLAKAMPKDWKAAKNLWTSQVQSHARHGRLTPPVAPVAPSTTLSV